MRKLWYRIKLRIALSFVKDLDEAMKKAGWRRSKRRQFWREFVKSRKKLLTKMLKEVDK